MHDLTFLHRLFEAQAARRPEAPAILSGGLTVSYRELDERTNRLARHLRARGVRTGDRVGLLLERSPDAVVAILSVLKSGATYIPLDPTHPGERQRHIVAEADVRTLVSEGSLREAARALVDRVIEVDDPSAPWMAWAGTSLADHEVDLRPSDLAYVLYTSGSTGRPKGVMAEHRNVVSFVRSFNEVVRLTAEDRVFQGFALTFDGSVEEMWMAFSNGATLVVPHRGAPRFGDDLARLIAAGGVTVFSTVPTSLSLISDPLSLVRLLIVSGERCSKELVARWAVPARRMLNVYGPTETTVNATAAECRPEAEVTIGVPLPGYGMHILDEALEPVAPGARGELFITGPGVARGYLGQPELTSKHFVDLRADGSGAVRAYRTGDSVSVGDDGALLFWGRLDNQVKVRGYRVELSEIEAVLSEDPAVRTAVVITAKRGDAPELAAYVVGHEGDASIDRGRLYALLSSRLPSYMVPAFLEELPAMPMLSSGKVDRARLPAPQTAFVPANRVLRGPRDEIEAALLRVFRSLFENDAISTDDDFFRTLGGYSLLAARLVSQLRAELGYDVAIREVYEHATIEDLAAHLSRKGGTRPRSERPPPREPSAVPSRSAFQSLSGGTRLACAVLQLAGVYAVYGLWVAPLLPCLLAFRAWETGNISLAALAGILLATMSLSWPVMLLLSIAAKWLVIGRYKAGAYPLWGSYYVRFWLVRQIELAAVPGPLAGTPLLPLYFRLMGARVGRNCTIDTVHCAIFDLLTIGDETSIGAETQLQGYHVEDGMLRLGAIDVGRRCFVGIHSALGLDARMGDDARLDDLSLLPQGAYVPSGEGRRGSPARPAQVPVPEPTTAPSSRARRGLFALLHAMVILALPASFAPSLVPGLLLADWAANRFSNEIVVTAFLGLAGIVAMLTFCLWLPVVRWVLAPRVEPGVYPIESLFYLRKWAIDLLMQTSKSLAKPLYTTIYLPAWLRLLGAKIGRRAEISTVSQIAPELTELGEQSFFADGCIIGGRRAHRGVVALAKSRVGRRSFVGNSAILPVGKTVGDGCLLGCLSAPPMDAERTPDGTEWLGSPSFALPHRRKVDGFAESVTHEPTRALIAQRLLVDALRIVLPPMIAAVQLRLLQLILLRSYASLPLTEWVLFAPLAAMGCAMMALLCVVATKKILIGTFQPVIKPLWSTFVWLNEAVNGVYETVAAPLLTPVLGTPFCAPWLRLMGCKIGRHVYLETTLFSEFDLVHIGDYAAINAAAIVQNHLFEDRIMKASRLTIGEGCCVGAMAVVLYDTEMQAGSSIGPLSLLMKGEVLPPHTRWVGIPTAEVPLASAALAPASEPLGQPTLVEGWS